jgi:hypothetical protein
MVDFKNVFVRRVSALEFVVAKSTPTTYCQTLLNSTSSGPSIWLGGQRHVMPKILFQRRASVSGGTSRSKTRHEYGPRATAVDHQQRLTPVTGKQQIGRCPGSLCSHASPPSPHIFVACFLPPVPVLLVRDENGCGRISLYRICFYIYV